MGIEAYELTLEHVEDGQTSSTFSHLQGPSYRSPIHKPYQSLGS